MYSVAGYGQMIADSARLRAHEDALRRVIRPGSVMLEVGAGVGVFSLLACQLGAERVYAIELNNAIQVAREAARANGFEDRVTVLRAMSTEVDIPEQVDVLLSDLRGVLPLFGTHIPSILDARSRFLKPGGVQLPARDELWIAPVHLESAYRALTEPWEAFGLDLKAVRTYATNTVLEKRARPSQLMAEPRCWATLDYLTIEKPNVTGSAEWTIDEPGVVNGFSLWFTATLIDGVTYTTSPFVDETVHGMAYCPLDEPLGLTPGDELRVTMRADLVAGSYVWTWTTTLHSGGDVRRMRQSTLFSMPPPPPEDLAPRAETFQPISNSRGNICRFVIELMDGAVTVGEIVDRVWERFPDDFGTRSEALSHVADLSVNFADYPDHS